MDLSIAHVMTTRRNLIDLYKRHKDDLITCPQCPSPDPISLDNFRKIHVQQVHSLTCLDCEFCFGAFRWKRGTLGSVRTVEHQHRCFNTFRATHQYTPPETEPTSPIEEEIVEEEIVSVCNICKNFNAAPLKLSLFGRKPTYKWKRIGFYDPIFRKPSWWMNTNVIPLNYDSGLGPDTVVMFQRYEEFFWYLVSVKPFAFPHFKKDLRPIRDYFAVLPYECLCDGLETSNDMEQRHHRHMIIAVKKNHVTQFRNIWRRKIHNPNHSTSKGKVLKEIKDAYHLAAVIHYVSQRQSSSDVKKLSGTHQVKLSHYWIARPVYPHSKLGMSTLFPCGLQRYVTHRNKQKLVVDWIDKVKLNRQHKYTIPIKELKMPIQYCIVPVRSDLLPYTVMEECEENHFKLFLYEQNKILVFKLDPDLLHLSKEEWYRKQIDAGNCFVASIKNNDFVLNFSQQKTMRQLKTLKYKHEAEFKKELEILKCPVENLEMKTINADEKNAIDADRKIANIACQMQKMAKELSSFELQLEDIKLNAEQLSTRMRQAMEELCEAYKRIKINIVAEMSNILSKLE